MLMKENGLLVMFSCNTCPVVINNQARTKEICQFAAQAKVLVWFYWILMKANRKSSESLAFDAGRMGEGPGL